MLPEQKPPQDVVDLVNQFKQAPDKFELVIYDNMFFLYDVVIEKGADGEPTEVHIGSLQKRAYWRDAAGISLDMMKSRLGIR